MLADMAAILVSFKDLSIMLERKYPSSSLLTTMKKELPYSYNGKRRSSEFLKIICLQFKKVVNSMLERKAHENINRTLEMIDVSVLQRDLRAWVHENKDALLASYLRKLSALLTKRVKWLLRKKKPFSPISWRDVAIQSILQGGPICEWERKRKAWRDGLFLELTNAIKALDANDMISSSIERVQLAPNRILKRLLTGRFRRTFITGMARADFFTFMESEVALQAELEMKNAIKDSFMQELRTALKKMQVDPWKWVKKPVYARNTMNFNLDDNQAYKVSFNDADPEVIVHLSFKARERMTAKLHKPERFHAMLKKRYRPLKPTLIKLNGRKLVLSIPFSKIEEEKEPLLDHFHAAGVDLGLKDFAVLSIAPCTKQADGTMHVGSVLRSYHIDQKELSESRDSFLKRGTKKVEFFNVKRKLTNLQKTAYLLQAKRDAYKNRHPKIFRNKIKFMKLRTELKRVWRKINNIHQELAHQIGCRIIEACKHHDVKVLNLEDLSWAKHERKENTGFFLARNQIHWFFEKVQHIIMSRARQEQIEIRKIDARYTSKRCSRCNSMGVRSGKRFSCNVCGLKMDSDKNASINILKKTFPCTSSVQGPTPVLVEN